MKLDKDLLELLALFRSKGVEFLIVGGHAVALHGYPRLEVIHSQSTAPVRHGRGAATVSASLGMALRPAQVLFPQPLVDLRT